MRKAIIAAIVATALFAVGAFAANFTVTSSDVASGSDSVGRCADEALVEYTTRPAFDQDEEDFVLATVVVTFYDAGSSTPTGDCDGGDADAAVKSGDGIVETTDDLYTWEDLTGGTVSGGVVTFTVSQDIPVGPIEGINVMVNGNAIRTTATA